MALIPLALVSVMIIVGRKIVVKKKQHLHIIIDLNESNNNAKITNENKDTTISFTNSSFCPQTSLPEASVQSQHLNQGRAVVGRQAGERDRQVSSVGCFKVVQVGGT